MIANTQTTGPEGTAGLNSHNKVSLCQPQYCKQVIPNLFRDLT